MPSAIELGQQALLKGNPARAASFFEFALKKAPADAPLRLLVADTWLEGGLPSRALPHLRWILEQSDMLSQGGEFELLSRARYSLRKAEEATLEAPAPAPLVEEPPEVPPATAPAAAMKEPRVRKAARAAEPPIEERDGFSDVVLASSILTNRPRILACPRCAKTVLLDDQFRGRCECDWFQPPRGAHFFLEDLQRLCRETRSVLSFRLYHDIFVLDGTEIRIKMMSLKAIKVDPQLAFELDLGHPIIRPEELAPVMPKIDLDAPFRLQSRGSGSAGTEFLGTGEFYTAEALLALIATRFSDALGLLPRNIHLCRQISQTLSPRVRKGAERTMSEGARSFGQCLLAQGMSVGEILNLGRTGTSCVPAWATDASTPFAISSPGDSSRSTRPPRPSNGPGEPIPLRR